MDGGTALEDGTVQEGTAAGGRTRGRCATSARRTARPRGSRLRPRGACAAALLAAVAAGIPPASAQPFSPPALVEAATPVWPGEIPAIEQTVIVPCRVTLDETGAVTDVELLEPQGGGFDEVAVDAIRRSAFAPARQGDRPIPARFVFRWEFRPTAPDAPPPDVPPPDDGPPDDFVPDDLPPDDVLPAPEPVVTLEGEVLDEGDVPLEGAAVAVTSADLSEPVVAVTDADGRFYFLDLPPGRYGVRVSAPAFATFEGDEEVSEGEVTEVRYRLDRRGTSFETVVRAQRPPREVTRRTIETREIEYMPGTGGDALRAITNMPGVARPIGGSGLIVIRGSSPQDTAFYMDGISVPLLYHFGGLRSVVAADLLERIDFYPGNYSVRYSGVTAGVIDVVPRSPTRERWTGYFDVNLLDAGAFAEGPLAGNASIAAGVRRSYIDAVLPAILETFAPDAGFSSITAPVYWDYQLLSEWEPSEADRLRFFVYGSDDRVAVLFAEPDQGDPTLAGERTAAIAFHRFQAEWVHDFSPRMENRVLLGVGYNALDVGVTGLLDVFYDFVPIQVRDEFRWEVTDAFQLTLGIDSLFQWQRARARLPDFFGNPNGRQDSLCSLEILEVDGSGWEYKPGFYLETEFRPAAGLRLLPGIRFDLYDDGRIAVVDPRVNVRYELVEGTTLKAGIGSYTQPPDPQQSSDETGNPDLALERSWHFGLGLEQRIWGPIDLQVDLFYKTIDDVVQRSDRRVVRDGVEVPLRYENTAEQRAYGIEVLARYRPDDLFFGWIALTLMRAEQRDAFEDWSPTFFDQLLNLTLLGSFDLGAGWKIGFKFRVAQGFPRTPIVGAVYNADCDQYEGIPGPRNAIRLPWFHQLDLRVDKTFEWESFRLDLYLDIQNVYYQENVETIGYNYDFTQRTDVTGLPIIPAIGIKGEF
jgi:TonB family protein